MTDIKERGDQMEEACGVFGIYAQDESINVAEAAYYGLFALQHRGQESAGIAVADGKGIKHYRNLGLVPEVFDEEILHGLTGHISIGHVRYSTFGGKDVINAQPLVARCKIGMLALAHNGNLVNADALRSQMEDDGAIFQTTVDTEVILSLIARESSKGLIEAVRSMMEKVRGSYALVLLAKDKLIGIRDPYGIRPLCLGRVGSSFVLASESCALDAVEAGTIDGQIVLVLANASKAFALERAKKHGIPAEFVSKKQAGSDEAFNDIILQKLKAADADLVVLAGYLPILGRQVVRAYEHRIINIHPALIPAFCGPGMYGHHVHEAVLAYGAKISGATTHFVDEQVDHGGVIMQKSVPVLEGDTPETLAARVLTVEHEILPESVRLFCAEKLGVDGRQVHVL